jgi:hypothetical protein
MIRGDRKGCQGDADFCGLGVLEMEIGLWRGYHSSSCGGVIYYMYNTSTFFYPSIA